MIIQSARNPQYTADGGIDLLVMFAEIGDEIPFHATPDDSEQHGRDLCARAIAGEFGPIAPYVAPEPVIIVPATITKRQACLHLLTLELYDEVVALIQSAGKAATIEWEATSIIARDNPLMASIQSALGWSSEQVDEFFINANSIT